MFENLRIRDGNMRLGFFTMPMHPPHRNWVETLKEDRQSFILADKLGFYDAFCGEHIADVIENVTNSFQFLATLDPRNASRSSSRPARPICRRPIRC